MSLTFFINKLADTYILVHKAEQSFADLRGLLY